MKLGTYALILVPLTAFALGAAGCSSDNTSPGDTADAAAATDSAANPPPADGGQDSSTGPVDSGGGGSDSHVSPDGNGSDSGAITDAPPGTDGGAWVDMNSADGAADPHACDNQPGVACGWSATNNGLGYTCRCANPTWADPWGCEAPDSGAPTTCPVPDGGGD